MINQNQSGVGAARGSPSVAFGGPSTAGSSFQTSHLSTRSFDEVLARLQKEIDHAGLKLLHEIDPQKALQGIGQSIGGSRLIFFLRPKLVVHVLEADCSAMVEAPLKLVVTELSDRTVSVRMADPGAIEMMPWLRSETSWPPCARTLSRRAYKNCCACIIGLKFLRGRDRAAWCGTAIRCSPLSNSMLWIVSCL
jgi:uncharacterized protein (DUF302 family)